MCVSGTRTIPRLLFRLWSPCEKGLGVVGSRGVFLTFRVGSLKVSAERRVDSHYRGFQML